MRVEVSRRVPASRERVWEFVSDGRRYREFMEGVTEMAPGGGASLRLWRARYLVRMQAGAAEFGGLVEVVEWAEPSDLAWTSVTGITQRGRWRLRERESGCTEVTLRLSYSADGGLLGWVAERVAGVMVRSQLRRTLVRLADLVAEQQPR